MHGAMLQAAVVSAQRAESVQRVENVQSLESADVPDAQGPEHVIPAAADEGHTTAADMRQVLERTGSDLGAAGEVQGHSICKR